ncbi:unnamed protein product, partial [Urochloa humidicola]
AFPPHADGGWRGGGDAGGEVASSRRLPCLAGPLSTHAQVSAASSRRPPSTSVLSLFPRQPPRRPTPKSTTAAPRISSSSSLSSWTPSPAAAASRSATPLPSPAALSLPLLHLASRLAKKKKSTPLAAVRRLPPESGGSQQGRRWIRRRHATWWWVRPRHAACWRVRPRRLDVPSAQRHWPCTRMAANVRSQAKGRGLMVVFFVSPIFASVLFLALIFKRCVCSPSQLKHNLDLALSESIPYFLAHRIAFFEGSIAYSDFVFFSTIMIFAGTHSVSLRL